jgi:adenylylsulfate kinase-like enzyme
MADKGERSRVLVVTKWLDGDEVRVRLLAADLAHANEFRTDVAGAVSWFQSWLALPT